MDQALPPRSDNTLQGFQTQVTFVVGDGITIDVFVLGSNIFAVLPVLVFLLVLLVFLIYLMFLLCCCFC